MNAINTIQKIIQSRCNELNITYKELVIKTGYSNVSVGLKRLNQLFNNEEDAISQVKSNINAIMKGQENNHA